MHNLLRAENRALRGARNSLASSKLRPRIHQWQITQPRIPIKKKSLVCKPACGNYQYVETTNSQRLASCLNSCSLEVAQINLELLA